MKHLMNTETLCTLLMNIETPTTKPLKPYEHWTPKPYEHWNLITLKHLPPKHLMNTETLCTLLMNTETPFETGKPFETPKHLPLKPYEHRNTHHTWCTWYFDFVDEISFGTLAILGWQFHLWFTLNQPHRSDSIVEQLLLLSSTLVILFWIFLASPVCALRPIWWLTPFCNSGGIRILPHGTSAIVCLVYWSRVGIN